MDTFMRWVGAVARWLCPTEFDRARLAENERATRIAGALSSVVVALTLICAGPQIGWWPLALLAMSGVSILWERRLAKSQYPELSLLATTVLNLVLVCLAVGVTGGTHSVLFPWLILPVLANAPRYRPQVLVALTVAMMASFGIVVGVRGDIRTANDLLPLLVIATLFVSCTAGAYVLSSAEMRQRTAAVLDPLTGLLNRKTLSGRAAELAAQAQVTAQPLACITADIDCFKKINDEHGHAHGDVVLRAVAYEIRKELGGFESLYRTGGEEFLVLLPGLDAAAAVMVGERVRQAARTVRVGDAPVTVSVGVATALGASIDIRALFHRADLALYRAKAQGRDCLCLDGEAAAVPAPREDPERVRQRLRF